MFAGQNTADQPKLYRLIKELEKLKAGGRTNLDEIIEHAKDDAYPRADLIKELSKANCGRLAHLLYQGFI